LPFSGFALVFILAFLNVKYTRNPTWKQALGRVDFLGNAIFIPSIISVLFGLTFGGVRFPWNSFHIVVPLVLGFAGWILFHIHQASPLCREASIPPRVLSNRTSAAGYVLTLIDSMILESIGFFMPVYFQAVLGSSPIQSGIKLLPTTIAVVPFGIMAGIFSCQRLGCIAPFTGFQWRFVL
jgi:predicted neutral ceramidase superfamily lipid hydrolase